MGNGSRERSGSHRKSTGDEGANVGLGEEEGEIVGEGAKITLVECELGGSAIYSVVLGGGGKQGGEGEKSRKG